MTFNGCKKKNKNENKQLAKKSSILKEKLVFVLTQVPGNGAKMLVVKPGLSLENIHYLI